MRAGAAKTYTADNLTDPEIRAERERVIARGPAWRSAVFVCDVALGKVIAWPSGDEDRVRGDRQRARTCIAAVLNELVRPAVTPETITDAQIAELLDRLLGSALAHIHQHADLRACRVALGLARRTRSGNLAARDRCAAVYNALFVIGGP